ncbi:MAG: phosphatidate cytidylyltransferase, partial [Rhodospirillaceae bacterium]|nr:phosphatidate cytidylyltransferase [Rhodospirillaceae bacterium]
AGMRPGLALLAAGARATAAATPLVGLHNGFWRLVGVLYVGLSCLAILWLRAEPAAGLATVLWLLALVWATDIAAFAAGRRRGGPKLAPAISPGKTWSGLAGGVAAAAAVGAAAAWLRPGTGPAVLAALSAGLAVVEQLGDLFESAVKRRFGVKDSSAIIPGHGGFLDRVDGLMAVSLTVAGLALVGGRSILAW